MIFLTRPRCHNWLDADDASLTPQALRGGQPPRFAAEQMHAQLPRHRP